MIISAWDLNAFINTIIKSIIHTGERARENGRAPNPFQRNNEGMNRQLYKFKVDSSFLFLCISL